MCGRYHVDKNMMQTLQEDTGLDLQEYRELPGDREGDVLPWTGQQDICGEYDLGGSHAGEGRAVWR